MEQPRQITAAEIKRLAIDHRYRAAASWVKNALEVTERTGNLQARAVFEFLDTHTTLGVPMPNGGIQYIFRSKPDFGLEEYAFLTPILPRDAGRLTQSDFRHAYAKGTAPVVAEYRERSRAIYFAEHTMSPLGQGVIMLHEAMHALNDLGQKYDRSDPEAHWLEEADVFTFEFELLKGLFGDGYEELISERMKNFSRKGQRISFGDDLPSIEHHWSRIFGDHISNREQRLWTSVWRMDAFWRYLQKNYSDQATTDFAKYLRHHNRQ